MNLTYIQHLLLPGGRSPIKYWAGSRNGQNTNTQQTWTQSISQRYWHLIVRKRKPTTSAPKVVEVSERKRKRQQLYGGKNYKVILRWQSKGKKMKRKPTTLPVPRRAGRPNTARLQ